MQYTLYQLVFFPASNPPVGPGFYLCTDGELCWIARYDGRQWLLQSDDGTECGWSVVAWAELPDPVDCWPQEGCMTKMLDRVADWDRFAAQVREHIIQYATPQYGNRDGSERLQQMTARECVDAIRKYLDRHGRNVRGPIEDLRDLLKIAHYAQCGFDKLALALGCQGVYQAQGEHHDID